MKKLLALVLCVMLFVSVIPTSAFAAVDLKPAVDAMNNLYGAYTVLAVATGFVNAYHGFKDLADLFPDTLPDFNTGISIPSEAKNRANNLATWAEQYYPYFLNSIRTIGPMSPEGLFKTFGYGLTSDYDDVGQGVVIDCKNVERLKTQEIQNNINNELARLTALNAGNP